MAEPTITDENIETTGAETPALPVADETPAADETQTNDEPSKESEGEEEDKTETSLPETDDKLQSFAKGQGIDDISELSERELKLLKVAKDNQAEFQRNRQKASELEKSVTTQSDSEAEKVAEETGQDPELLKRLQRVEVRESIRDFWNQEGIDKAFEPAMIDLLKTKPYLAGDLESLYAAAVMKSGGVAAVKSQGKREALESLAHKQQAAVPAGNATTKDSPKGKDFKDLSIKEMEKQLGFIKR